jgi:hypothetical protein
LGDCYGCSVGWISGASRSSRVYIGRVSLSRLRFHRLPIVKFKMTPIQWDSQQFYQPPRPVAIPPSTFWPPSHPQPGVGSTHFQSSTAGALFEGVKRAITHDAAQMHMSSSADHAELPLNHRQRQSLPGTGGMCQCFFMTTTADQMQKPRSLFDTMEMQTSAMQRRSFLLSKNSYYQI